MSAGSVYEAVAQALCIFRDNEWVEDIGCGQTPIFVKIKSPEIEHMFRVQDFERWLDLARASVGISLFKINIATGGTTCKDRLIPDVWAPVFQGGERMIITGATTGIFEYPIP